MATEGVMSVDRPADAPEFAEHDIAYVPFEYDGDETTITWMWWKYVPPQDGLITFDVILSGESASVGLESNLGWGTFVSQGRYGMVVTAGETVWIKARAWRTLGFSSLFDLWQHAAGGAFMSFYPDYDADFVPAVVAAYGSEAAGFAALNAAYGEPVAGPAQLIVRSSDVGPLPDPVVIDPGITETITLSSKNAQPLSQAMDLYIDTGSSPLARNAHRPGGAVSTRGDFSEYTHNGRLCAWDFARRGLSTSNSLGPGDAWPVVAPTYPVQSSSSTIPAEASLSFEVQIPSLNNDMERFFFAQTSYPGLSLNFHRLEEYINSQVSFFSDLLPYISTPIGTVHHWRASDNFFNARHRDTDQVYYEIRGVRVAFECGIDNWGWYHETGHPETPYTYAWPENANYGMRTTGMFPAEIEFYSTPRPLTRSSFGPTRESGSWRASSSSGPEDLVTESTKLATITTSQTTLTSWTDLPFEDFWEDEKLSFVDSGTTGSMTVFAMASDWVSPTEPAYALPMTDRDHNTGWDETTGYNWNIPVAMAFEVTLEAVPYETEGEPVWPELWVPESPIIDGAFDLTRSRFRAVN